MAVNNKTGSIIAKHVIGNKPVIYFDKDSDGYSLILNLNQEIYDNIFEEVRRCGLVIYRDSIDNFVSNLREQDMVIQYVDQIYQDNQILAGERVRLFSKNGELDLLKIRPRYYICTKGDLKGKTVILKSNTFTSTEELIRFNIMSMAFLVPNSAFTVLDYTYLKIYRCDVVTDISGLYNELSVSVQNNTMDEDFHKLLSMCGDLGVSLWTLMGILDYLQLKA